MQEASYLNLGMCWFKLGNMDKCIDNCRECLEINPVNSKALLRRGLAYEKEKKFDEALADAKAAIEIESEGGGAGTPVGATPGGAAGLKDRCDAAIKKQKAAQKDIFSKMFGKK